ncbi:GNAT family N-acetyltransferase [Neolewinella persica]|uniref:GNAT family N-acetyltransferase n=1 Tax=Neolewinella persica TaxID=70998 RepID=UPI00035D15B8|nr:GNAT family N-acetyltransferase [Neolewinella persica]
MIRKLKNNEVETAHQIRSVFQRSYAVEAALLKATEFPPLKRPLEAFLECSNPFFGYIEGDELTGVVEVERNKDCTGIRSLVVCPKHFRRGIGSKLVQFVFDEFDAEIFVVETGVDNGPAIELYGKLGFREVKQWETGIGIRKVKFERRVCD